MILWSVHWRQLAGIIAFLLLISPVNALDRISFTVDQIQTKTGLLKQLEIAITGIETDTPRLSLDSGLLHPPAPFNNIRQISIQCADFVMQAGLMACKQGKGRVDWPALSSPRFDLSFNLTEQQGVWEINRLKLWGGMVNLRVTEKQWRWRVEIQARNLDLARLQRFFKLQHIKKITGKVSINGLLTGEENTLHRVEVNARLHSLRINAIKEKLLTEKIRASIQLYLSKHRTDWFWKARGKVDEGAVFYDPVFLTFNKRQSLSIAASGSLQTRNKRLSLKKLLLKQGDSLEVTGTASFNKKLDADLQITISQLREAAKTYLSPFLETGPLADLQLSGQMRAAVGIKQNQLDRFNATLEKVDIQQPGNHIDIQQLDGELNWRRQEHAWPSFLHWRKLTIKKIPVESGQLDFKLFDKQMALSKPAELSLLNGVFSIRKFSFQAVKNDDAKLYFEGEIKNLSLEKLTEALDWTPLSGTISGYIPAVHYQDKTLRLDGQLAIQVFDGEIIIKELSSSGLFGFSPRLHTDILFNNLDLKQITQKFQIGRIEGRLSGFAHNVYLENWRPVTFYAWLGTPDDDDSRHVISQKAVENIASIGGGGAADVISRGFLRFFDTFGYDKLGFGCYLHDGVCQMMGVEAAENGYYLIKGGGLPRIDVIGYNPRLDWNVLIQRLKRIGSNSEVIVQ